MLARDTDWRQGDLLTFEAAAALGLVSATAQGHRAIVITHDCDLPHESEHWVEVIVAELVVKDPKPDPQPPTPRTRDDSTSPTRAPTLRR